MANDARMRGESPEFYVKKNLLGADDVDPPVETIGISTTGEAEATRIDIIQPERMHAKAEDERFMNELVEILIEASDDPNAPLFVETGHNGVQQYVQRGVPQTIKRRYLYSLCAAKQARMVCDFGRDAGGKEFNRLEGPKIGTHRVTVLNDTAAGRAKYTEWLRMP